MITFYPRNIALWREEFDFNPDITLTPKEKTNYKVFHNREELIEFLKDHGIKLDEPLYPLQFNDCGDHVIHGKTGCQAVVQCGLIGWIKDDYR